VGRPDANPNEILGFWDLGLVKFRFLGEGLLKILTKPAPAEEIFEKSSWETQMGPAPERVDECIYLRRWNESAKK
jgi:hypothetical protein